MDGPRFVTDALRTSLDHALRDRSGIKEVRRRLGGHSTHFGVRIEFRLATGKRGYYAFRVGAKQNGAYEVQTEECKAGHDFFRVRAGETESSVRVFPKVVADRLGLVAASGLPEFREVRDGLSSMGFYSLNPDVIRDLQAPDPGTLLLREGSNLAGVLGRMASVAPDTKRRVEEYLGKVVPGIAGVDHSRVGPRETLEFRQEVAGAKEPWWFSAANMSDGTLRALGVLVAIFQSSNGAEAASEASG